MSQGCHISLIEFRVTSQTLLATDRFDKFDYAPDRHS